ncbi:MAG: translocation/assembly module TamB domain-containing protein [Burkholderiaceae bacterium]|nr:translocation/assembly module TamB domain-containing protein [Burkholderiaceae bacterium]
MADAQATRPAETDRPRRRGARRLAMAAGSMLALMVALVAAGAGTAWWLLRSDGGSAWLLRQVPGLTVDGPQGALLGPDFSARQLQWQGTAGRLDLQGLRATGLQWQWRPAPGIWLALAWQGLEAERVQWQPAASAAAASPTSSPTSLRLPVMVQAPIRVGSLQIGGAPVLHDLQAQLHLGDAAGARHRIDGLQLRWAGGEVAATAAIGTGEQLPLDVRLQVRSPAGAPQDWRAELAATGPLAAPVVTGTLRALDDAAQATLDARLAPFAAFPLSALRLQAQAFDLSRLDARWPQTQLDVQAELVEPAAGRPLKAHIAVGNRQPGRWNEGRVPLRSAQAQVTARLDQPDRLQLDVLQVALADGGRLEGTGLWQGHAMTLEVQAAALKPQALDGRAPAWQVDGAVGLELRHLPSPDPQAAAPAEPWRAEAALALQGRYAASPASVRLQAQVRAAAGQWQVDQLLARADTAEARGSLHLAQTGQGWRVASQLALVQLDPAALWPGLGPAWQRGPHRLNGHLETDLQWPVSPKGPLDWRRIAGTATVQLDDSQLAGVPLSGRAALGADAMLDLNLSAGGNRFSAQGQIDRRGEADRWTLEVAAPDLATLAPLAALHPALASVPQAGQVQGQAQVAGRWPALQGEGQFDVQGLRAGAVSLAQADLRWSAGSDLQTPLQLTLQARSLKWQQQTLAVLNARLEGTPASHRLSVDAALPLLPPDAVMRSLGLPAARGMRWAARADGQLARQGDGWQWRGGLSALTAGAWDGRQPLAGAAPRDWLDSGPLRAELDFDAAGALQQLHADAGRLRVADTFTLAWDDVRLAGDRLALQARLEGFAVTPLLARWQPDMGWEGNLRVGGRLEVALGETTRIDAVIEREGGDLGVRESDELSIPFGLSDLRLALQAQDGTWTFTQALAGRALGELGGVQQVFSTAAARWPGQDDRLEGAVLGRVANLGVWGAWVPPGWRLQGTLTADARLGGRVGAPELRGELSGDGLGVRNLLQGVHVRDGQVRLRLEGERATVERFVLKGGDGSLTLTGGATLGAEPRAELALQAERLQLLSRIDRRLTTSGQATLSLAPQTLTLRGGFTVDEGLFDASRSDAPALDDDVVIRRAGATESDTQAPTEPPRNRRTDVALDVDLGPRLQVRGRGLDTRLAGRLKITAPGGRLAVTGTVNAVDGTYAAYAQKLEIRRGELAFSGDAANPRLDVLALRPNLDIDVGVAITGNVQSPRVRLYSNPDLSETDKLSWLVLGRDPAGLGRTDTALLQRAAVALLAGEGEAPTDALMRNLGLDEFSLRQDENDAGARETVVSLGKQLSRRWYVGYERGVNATVGTWQLIYRVAQRFTLRAQSGSENALDAIWVWRVP